MRCSISKSLFALNFTEISTPYVQKLFYTYVGMLTLICIFACVCCHIHPVHKCLFHIYDIYASVRVSSHLSYVCQHVCDTFIVMEIIVRYPLGCPRPPQLAQSYSHSHSMMLFHSTHFVSMPLWLSSAFIYVCLKLLLFSNCIQTVSQIYF